MKYKELVKKASISQTVLERKQEMEKLATVRKYMDYGLSFDTASALVKSSAAVGAAAKAAQAAPELSKLEQYAKETGALHKIVSDVTGMGEKAVSSVRSVAEAAGVGKKKESTLGKNLAIGSGAAGLAGLAGLSIGMNHSRDKKRMPDYGQE